MAFEVFKIKNEIKYISLCYMNSIKQSLGVSNYITKHSKLYRRPLKADEQTHIKDNVPIIDGYNYMADILHLPTDKFGFNKLLVIVDIGSDAFDIEKMKGETAKETLNAYKKLLTRNIIKLPYASMLTDGGSSFQSEFHKYLYDNGVDHRTAIAGRHHQLSNADNLCRQLGDLFNAVMNQKENETGKQSKAWVSSIDIVREKLNEFRKKQLKLKLAKKGSSFPVDLNKFEYPIFDSVNTSNKKIKYVPPKFKIGEMVHVLYNEPRKFNRNQNGENVKQNTKNFRMGDLRLSIKKYKIIQVLYYSGNPPYRYLLDGYPTNRKQTASFTEEELKR